MNQNKGEVKAAVRYSEAFKLAVVREVESGVVACERAGIKDVAGFKKKVAGPPDTKP